MKKIVSVITFVSLISFISTVQATEHCPEPSKIEEVSSGVYKANGENGEWSGVLQGIFAQQTSVQSFRSSIAIQQDNSAPLKLQYCSYDINHNNKLDMRFIPHNNKEFTIKPEGKYWVTENGPFSLIYNICENTAAKNCTFTIIN